MTDQQLREIWSRHMGKIVCGDDELRVLHDVATEAVREAGLKPETPAEKFDRTTRNRL